MEASPKTIINYETQEGRQPFRDWISSLKDKPTVARIRARINRIEQGNFGDSKTVGEGVLELRLKFGSGYRVYFAQDGVQIVVLLIGGDKSTQDQDVLSAHKYWADYKRRTQHETSK